MTSGTSLAVDVPRRTVIDDIAKRLNELQQTSKKISHPIINMHGIAGIGKTYAVRQLYEHFEGQYNLIWLGFDPAELRRTHPEDQHYIQPLANALAILDRLPTLHRQIEPPADQRIDVFCRSTPLEAPYTLLLLDALDDLPIWKWLQEAIIKPLCEQQSTMIVCTSQSPLFWDYWELRDWCEEYELAAFDQDEIAYYLKQRGLTNFQHLIETVQDYTLGYPLAVSNLADQIAEADVVSSSGGMQRERLDALSADDWRILEYVGIMRLAEIDVMRKLLDRITDRAGHAVPSLMELTTLLKKLQVADFLRSTRPDLPKQLAAELRQEVKARIEQIAPGRYTLICEHLEMVYYNLAIDKPKTAVHACVEWLYFSSELPLDGADERKRWLGKLQTILARAIAVNEAVIRDARASDLITADASLAVLFYRDQELIAKLQRFNVFKDVDMAMQRFLDVIQGTLQECRRGVDVELKELTALPLRIDLEKSCSTVLKALSERLPVELLPELIQGKTDFTVKVRFLIEPDEVDVDHLRQRVSNAAMFLSPRQLNDILTMFRSRGLLSYNRSRRTYQFHHLIKNLVSFTEERPSHKLSSISGKIRPL